MIFIDTGAWYALATPSDPDYQAASSFAASISEPFLTSNFVVDELLTLFMVRGLKAKGVEWYREVLSTGGAVLVDISQADFDNAVEVYERFADKRWSFTDCTSYALMQRLDIHSAFSFDQHFQQFGTVTVFPGQTSRG